MLRAIIQEQPHSSLDEVTRELFRRAGVKVSTVTVRKALHEAGIERLSHCVAPVSVQRCKALRRRDTATPPRIAAAMARAA